MDHDLIQKAEEFGKKHKKRRLWKRSVSVMGLLLAVTTTYALILPAITQEREVICGLEEHVHTEECLNPLPVLICTAEENHVHDPLTCYEQQEGFVCGMEETPGHTHTDICYTSQEVILCGLEETEGHTHGEGCHTPQSVLSCGTEESSGHSHSDSCYESVLICSAEESAGHTHSEGCHDADGVLICGTEESSGHSHSGDCYESRLSCGLSEGDGAHSHSDTCYITENILTCTLAECAPHTHDDTCKGTESVLSCGQEEHEAHTHTDECKGMVDILLCTQPENHVHEDACFELPAPCELEEHTHEDSCYAESSDPNADLEYYADWEATLQDVELTGIWADDLLAIAKTQLGYTESTRNFIYDDNYNKKGYTRYGAWYGAPYGDWCAMFVAFCLEYAGIPEEDFPRNAACDYWVDELLALDMYRASGSYTPIPGDLIFYDWDDDPYAEHIGIVAQVDEDTVTAIEGNTSNTVAYRTYDLDDPCVIGYGLLPENPEKKDTAVTKTAVIYTDATYETVAEDATVITLTGDIPEDSEIRAYPVVLENENLLCAYDITIFLPDGSIHESSPDQSVTVSIESPAVQVDTMEVYYHPDEGEPELVESTITENGILFDTNHFSVYGVYASRAATQDLLEYIEAENADQPDPDKHASVSFRLIDMSDPNNPKELSPDENGQYTVTPGEDYTFSIDLALPSGIHPGSYSYQIPEGVEVTGGSGTIVTKAGVELGTWSVDDSGNIIINIADTTDAHTQITILAAISIKFIETEDPVEFDGGIHVVVKVPEGDNEQFDTWYNKGANEFVDLDGNGEPEMIEWHVVVEGNRDSNLIGMPITDYLRDGQIFDEKAKAEDITIHFVSSNSMDHYWTLNEGDPGFTWGEQSWTYRLPESVYCEHCNETIQLTDQTKFEFIYYSSITIEDVGDATPFGNHFRIEGDGEADGWGMYYADIGETSISKDGKFNYETAKFEWTINLTLPAYSSSAPVWLWSLSDTTEVQYNWQSLNPNYYTPNYMLDGTIFTTFTTIDGVAHKETVPNIDDADGSTKFAYYIAESYDLESGEPFSYELYLLSKCDCTEGKCYNWQDGTCHAEYSNKGYCTCWTVNHPTSFTFEYSDAYADVVSQFGGIDGYLLNNTVHLYKNGDWFSYGGDYIEIPGVFDKQKWINEGIPDEYAKYIASFQITVNEAMLDLSSHDELTIIDTMTPTLDYLPNTMVITARDRNWQTTTLTEGTDYTVSYNSSTHVMTIILKDPGRYMYTLYYDTEIDITGIPTGEHYYENTASIVMFGKQYGNEIERVPITDIAATSQQYVVRLHKVDTNNNHVVVPGAVLALFDSDGNKLFEGVTDAEGNLDFVTSVTAGTLLHEHKFYYIQELAAPDGYKLDDSEHWFYFCNALNTPLDGEEPYAACDHEYCRHTLQNGTYTATVNSKQVEAKRLPGDNITIQIENEPEDVYELPETGGPGTTAYTIAGLALMGTACGAFLHRHRKKTKEDPYTS